MKNCKVSISFLVMAVATRTIKFVIEKGYKKPTPLDGRNSEFQIYSPELIKIRPGDTKYVFLKYSIHLPSDILTTFLIQPSLGNEGLQLIHYTETNRDERIRLEFFNKTHNKIFTLKKNSKIALFMMLNEETAGLKKVFETVTSGKN